MKRIPEFKRAVALAAICACAFLASAAHAGWNLNDIKKGADAAAQSAGIKQGSLSNDEVVRGLKEALSIGSKDASALASRVDGFYRNPRIRIPFPPEAQKVKAAAEAVGMKKQVDEFVQTLNRAAEEAAKRAAPIFLDAIKQMTIQDGFAILKGADNAATAYLQKKTTAPLTQAFRPVVHQAIEKVQVTKYWNPIATQYNQIPFVQKVNPDLDAYVTQKALQGLFTLIADEERKIRRNPSARVTDLLRRVFGSAS